MTGDSMDCIGNISVMFQSRFVKPAFGPLLVPFRPRPAEVARPAAVVIVVSLEILWTILPTVVSSLTTYTVYPSLAFNLQYAGTY
jgi:hypothetical protein